VAATADEVASAVGSKKRIPFVGAETESEILPIRKKNKFC
jgi:hypothetical protein